MNSHECFIGIDLGTTGIKVGAFDLAGNQIAFARRGFSLDQPHPGHIEFDIVSFFRSVVEALHEVIQLVSKADGTIGGVGLSSQAQTFVLLDEEQQPIRPAISWLDTRAGDEARELSQLSEKLTAKPVDAIASCPKVLWVARHEPAVFARCRYFSLLQDYITMRLTGRRVTGLRSAESTGAYDLEKREWVEPLLAASKLSADMMPEVDLPSAVAGRVHNAAALETGLPERIPVAVGGMDHLAGAMGTGNCGPGIGSAALGTALAVVVSTDGSGAPVPGVALRPHPVPGLVALLSYSKTAGIVFDWCHKLLASDLHYLELLAEAATVEPGSDGVLCYPHFAGMASPTFDPDARGAFVGLALHHERRHLIRAVIESLCFLMRENIERLTKAGGEVRVLRVTGGGAKSDFWLQMIADVCCITVERPKITESPCFGAAQFAMVAAGQFASESEASAQLYVADQSFEPSPEARATYDELYRKFISMHRRLYGTAG